MELASDTKALAAYSPTSTPILDGLRPTTHSVGKLSAGEYFFFSSLVILVLTGLPVVQELLASSPLSLPSWGLLPAGAIAVAVAMACAALVHEAGHWMVARISGFRLQRIKLGASSGDTCPVDQRLHSCEVLPLGILMLSPRSRDNLRARLVALVLGGPLANMVFAGLMEMCPYWAQAGVVTELVAHVFSAGSALLGIAALLPDTSRRGNFSDGARLLMLLKNDARAQRWMAILRMQLDLGQGVYPRAWDKDTVVRATLINDDSRDAVTANWLAYLWSAECQDITSATRYLEDALAAPASCSAWLHDRLFLEAAVFQAWFRDNPGKARSWVSRIQGNRLTAVQRLRLEIAMLWAEGKLFDAWERMAAYFHLLSEIPDSTARELAEKSAAEWKNQMESRMLTRAWRAMYTMSQEVELSAVANTVTS